MAPLTFEMLGSATLSFPKISSNLSNNISNIDRNKIIRKLSPEQEAKNKHLSELFNNVWYGNHKNNHVKTASQMHKAGSPSTAQTSINHGELTSKKQKTFDVNNLILLSKESFLLSSAGNAGNSQIVAIDSKIEQAMDLVKTHLMFAVREEVEILRNKILQLETTVIQLEAENAILREHVPAEVLQNLNGTSTQPTKPQTTYVTAQ